MRRSLARALLPVLVVASASALGCHKYGARAESPTTDQGPPSTKYWQPGGTANQPDQSKIKTSSNAPALRVLVVGNSIVYGLAAEIGHLAEAAGDAAIVKSIELSGAKLAEHLATGRVKAELDASKYDWVVLQEHTDVLMNSTSQTIDSVKQLDQQIKNAGARTMLVITWAYATGTVETQRVEQDKITTAAQRVAKETGVKLAPVGEAFQELHVEHGDFRLVKPDAKHPNFAGTYLAASVLYAMLYAKSPVGLPGPIGGGLSQPEADLLEGVAWKTVQAKSW